MEGGKKEIGGVTKVDGTQNDSETCVVFSEGEESRTGGRDQEDLHRPGLRS